MELSALEKQLQKHLGDGLVLVIGSGLSCAESVPGMGPLGPEHGIEYLARLTVGTLKSELHSRLGQTKMQPPSKSAALPRRFQACRT